MHKVPESQVGSRSSTRWTVPLDGTPALLSHAAGGHDAGSGRPCSPTGGQGNLTVQPHMVCCAPGRHGTVTTAARSGGYQAISKLQQHGGIVGRTEGFGLGGRDAFARQDSKPGKRLGLALIEQRGWAPSQRMPGAFQQPTGEFIPSVRVWAARRGMQRI